MNACAVEKYIPFLLPIGVFGVYLCTMTPVVYVGDSGEFTSAAFSLGIPHNSGYPLYSLLGKIFCMIPLGNVGFRMNLMSAFFSALTIFLVFDIVRRFTRNVLCSITAAGFLAFTPLFWSQTVSAEVYPLHVFFAALMIRLLMNWESTRDFRVLLTFVFVAGLSFGNHMQTVMLAPPVLYFIIWGDMRTIFAIRHFTAISIIFTLALTLYLYLPIRTQAGAAIHWGDPDSIERFLAHVTATAHRGAYVFTGGLSQYISRLLDAMKTIGFQYGMLTLFSIWGWIKLPGLRWKVFFAGVIGFDLIYTVFLNVISLEITPFTLPSAIVMAILLGVGLNSLLDWITGQGNIGGPVRKGVAVALCSIPIVTLITNYGLCDQRRNYTAYEKAINIFRTMDHGSTIFLDGDNNIFPVAYGRIVEGMGEGQQLYDRYNIIFKWSKGKHYPGAEDASGGFKSMVKDRIAKEGEKQSLYFAVFNPHAVSIPSDFVLKPYGILRKLDTDKRLTRSDEGCSVWDYYSTESFYDNFARDYMSREVCSFYFFRKAESLFEAGQVAEGLEELRIASLIGYNDTSIHSEIGLFLTDRGYFDEAREEFEKALAYNDDPSGIKNNWGYYHHRSGNYPEAINFFSEAIALNPLNYTYHNNLGLVFHLAGKKEEARQSFKRSLSINDDQPKIKTFIKTHGLQ
jgi:tetratricopeptide (TPR) repeat protein